MEQGERIGAYKVDFFDDALKFFVQPSARAVSDTVDGGDDGSATPRVFVNLRGDVEVGCFVSVLVEHSFEVGSVIAKAVIFVGEEVQKLLVESSDNGDSTAVLAFGEASICCLVFTQVVG